MDWTRRRLVAGGAGLTLAAVAGCLGDEGGDASDGNGNEEADNGNEAAEENDSDGNETDDLERDAAAALEDADVEDHTGQEEVTITVDPEADGDRFDPAAFEIDPETLLVWEWEGSSTEPYPLEVPEGCIWDEEVSEETVDDQSSGDEFDRLFTVPGAYLYASRDEDGEAFTGAFRVVEDDDE